MLMFVTAALLAQTTPPALSLAEAERRTLEHQPAVRQAHANAAVFDARSDQTMALLLPSINASAQFTRSHGSFSRGGSAAGGVVTGGTTNFMSIGVSGTQTLWDFGAIERLRASDKTVDAAKATERAVTLQVLLTTRRAFFATQATRALVHVAKDALENQRTHLNQIDQFVKAGLRTGIDLAQTQTLVANAELQLVNARNAYRLARAQLRQAISDPSLGDFEVADDSLPQTPREDEEVDVLVRRALDNRPELSSVRHQLEAQSLTVRAQHSGYIPTLVASGAVSEAGTSPDALGLNWSFGAALSWNLFAGGLTAAQVREARAAGDAVQSQLEAQLVQVRVDVETARLTVEDQRSAISAATTAVSAAKAQLTLAEGRYTQGVGSVLELSDAQILATTAAAQLVQANLALSTARAQLAAALGEMP
ncbi:MAG: TolC family protein [Archangium sp.]|nr:TolC family protein [Archangium sp.]